MATENENNSSKEYNLARVGIDLDSSADQLSKGKLSYALNAVIQNFDGNSVNYQNEPGNTFCLDFPEGYVLIGKYFINEQYKHIFFLTNPTTGNSQIGYMVNNDCKYNVIISDPCLGFDVNFPIHKVVHKITNCTTEIYWADNIARRYLDIDNVPYKLESGSLLCKPVYTKQVDCNQLKVQPNFLIPGVKVADVVSGGDIISGTYQFAVQYADAAGAPLTAYYSVTNPCPIFDPFTISLNFNTPVGKSIVVNIDNLDVSGQYEYFNLAVIKTINNIPSVDLVGTFSITGPVQEITYTGQNKELTALSINDIFEKFPYYDGADDLTAARDVLIWKGLTSIDRINYQSIASNVDLLWETWQIPAKESYKEETNATNFRGYLRDEVYTFELVFLLRNGKQTDAFHIPGREITSNELVQGDIPDTNEDFIGTPTTYEGSVGYSPYWKIYNTASVLGTDPNYSDAVNYKGPYQYGTFAYWESEEEYPCNEDVWGPLAGKKIRHHKFPDVAVSPISKSTIYTKGAGFVMEDTAIFPIGVKIDVEQVKLLISNSNLTDAQKDDIIGFKLVRGNRGTNRSIVAKGILRNVGKYTREDEDYYFPNYPYNDINEDPFLNSVNNAWTDECRQYVVTITKLIDGEASVRIIDCNNNKTKTITITTTQPTRICSIGFPVIEGPSEGTVTASTYDVYELKSVGECRGWRAGWISYTGLEKSDFLQGWWGFGSRQTIVKTLVGSRPRCIEHCSNCGIRITYLYTVTIDENNNEVIVDNPKPENPIKEKGPCSIETPLAPIKNQDTYRQVFNSPETSFGQPFLGTILKLESAIFGGGKAHFVEVKNNAKYRLLTLEAQQDSLKSAIRVGNITDKFDPIAFYSSYDSYLQIYSNAITRKNYAYQYNSIASYNYSIPIPNDLGIKQRNLEISRYLIPGVQNVGTNTLINNYNRETSVYLKTQETYTNDFVTLPKTDLPFPKDTPSIAPLGIEESSRYTVSSKQLCSIPGAEQDISVLSYYASIKNQINNQWGQIYSYSLVDTGLQVTFSNPIQFATAFGGDTFINRFAFKTKLPFFIDDRVGAPNDSDVFYDELGNIAYPKYWHSSRSILSDATIPIAGELSNFFSYKAHVFDCPNDQSLAIDPNDPDKLLPPSSNPNRTFYDGIFYLYSYGLPNFYCESSYNVDLRQAFNNKEGEFWPHVSTGIPDEWLQESNVSILQDNTYYYNITFSKQNKENSFTALPPDWSEKQCYTQFPFRAIYSDVQSRDEGTRVNNWLIYRAVSYHDFPQNYGKFVSVDSVENTGILARFENKTFLYNSLLTIDTSNPQAAYIGNNKLFSSAPPVDFSDTDLGFIGTQNKFLLKIPVGQISIDAKRGDIFLIKGTQVDLLSKLGSGLNTFLKEHLPFKILNHFPEVVTKIGENLITVPGVNIDNNFNGVGIHGVFDSKLSRFIFTKLDYIPLNKDIKLDPYKQEFYIETMENGIKKQVISLTDSKYFCNQSFTLSYNLNTNSWTSFHSYIPNFYVAENNFFYSGTQSCCDDFDFICGEVLNIPPTTTTTTTARFVPVCGPNLGTVEPIIDTCSGLSGEVILTTCTLSGTGLITVEPICLRPIDLLIYNFITGYTITPDPAIDSTISEIAACSAALFLNDTELTPPNLVINTILFNTNAIELGAILYTNNGTADCSVIPDGFYFTEESGADGIIYQVTNGTIVNIINCPLPSTTTTTTTIGTTTTTTTI